MQFIRSVLVLVLLLAVCEATASAVDFTKDDFRQATAIFQPLPVHAFDKENPLIPARVALGKELYNEKALSLDKDLSCASCHDVNKGGVDNRQFSTGRNGQLGGRNSPTSLNAALHFVQFWDGRAKDVEAQALGPILNPVEMAIPDEATAVARIKSIAAYAAKFAKAFPGEKEPLTYINIGRAIGAYERTLVTPGKFDKFLKGDQKVLTDTEKRGLKTFVSVGCVSCHSGATVGGQMFQKLGLVKPFPTKDLGRFEVTKDEADRSFFKVPGLRNVALTAPYFHDGSVKELPEAVKLMAEHQLGRTLTQEQTHDIVAFLGALSGEKNL